MSFFLWFKKKAILFLKIPVNIYHIIVSVDSKKAIYETFLMLLAILVIILTFFDLFWINHRGFTLFVEIFDLVVCGIFALDLFIKYHSQNTKKGFFKNHIIEIISIIPLDFVFRFFRLLKIFRFVKLSRLSKMGRLGNLINKMLTKFANPSMLRYKRYKNILFSKGLENDENEPLSKVKDRDSK